MSRVAVVGAGIAGCACAGVLDEAGHDVVVYDKSRGVGGRMASRRAERLLRFDYGAPCLTLSGAEREVAEHLEERGVIARWPGAFGRWDGAGWSPVDHDERWVGMPGMSAVARELLGGAALRTGRRVEAVDEDGRVALTSGEVDRFDRVVVALPAPQAVLVLPHGSLREALAEVEVEPCWALRIEPGAEPTPLTDGDPCGVHLDGPVAWLSREHTKPGRVSGPAWVVHATAAWSEAHLEDEPETVGHALVDSLQRQLGWEGPRRVEAHRWRHARVRRPVGRSHGTAGRLGSCGDGWLGGDVGDALRSGLALGRALS